MTGLRIAYVCTDPGVPVFGRKGCSVHVQEILRAFVRLGHDVTLLARRWGGDAPADLAAVPCVPLPPASGEGPRREEALAAADAALPGLLDRHGPFDVVYERHALWSQAAMDWARSRGLAGLLEVNAPLVEEQAAHRALYDRPRAEAMAQAAFVAAGGIIAVSSGVAQWLAAQGADTDKVAVVANGVDAARFAPVYGGVNAAPVIGFLGTLKPWHGLGVLLDAAEILRDQDRDFRLLIVGDGPERAALEARCAGAGLAGRCTMTGAVDPEAIPGLLARIDIAVAPYPDLDGFYFSPLKVMEYMAAGRAVVASRIGDIDGLIANGHTGLLCPPGDADALAKALALTLGDPALRERLGRAARAVAEARHGWDAAARRILLRAGIPQPC